MTRLQWLGSAVVVGATFIGLGLAVFVDPRVAFLLPLDEAAWIGPDIPVDTAKRRIGPGHSRGARFERRFDLPGEQELMLALRSLGRVEVEIDGAQRLATDDGGGCLKRRCTLSLRLGPGAHRMSVQVVNDNGPPLLALRLSGDGFSLATDTTWSIAPTRNPEATQVPVVADDTRRLPDSLTTGPSPGSALRALAPALIGLCLAGALTSALLRRRLPAAAASAALPLLLAAIAAAWLAMTFGRFAELPLRIGFDASGHLDYVRWLAAGRGIPDASDGWSMYHPPLFYVLAAVPVALADAARDSWAERMAMRSVPVALGLGNILLVGFAARRLFGGRRGAQAAAMGFAALLPLHLTQAAYVSNEIGHAFFASAALVAAMLALEDRSGGRRRLVITGLLLGCALLSKFTALLFAGVTCAFLLFERWQARGLPLRRALASAAGVALTAALVSGAFYVRNWIRFGDPFVWNLDVPGQESYWIQPGFHTAAFYLQLGDALRAPYYSSFFSFWDGQYTTFWGDGLIGGMAHLANRPAAWDWRWMSATFPLALPATLIIALGVWRTTRDAFVHADLSRRCTLALFTALLWSMGAATVATTLRYPFYGAPRASYALSLLVPISVCAARGFIDVDAALAKRDGGAAAVGRALYHGWIFTLAAAIAFTYMI